MATVCIGHMIPGPQGPAGADGTNGTNGVSAFTTLAAQFTVPAVAATVAVTVASSQWMSFGQVVYIVGAGYYEVASTPSSPWAAVTLENLGYTGNAAPTTIIASGAKVSPGGLEGPTGAAEAGSLLAANNLSDLANAAAARTNLGLGDAAVLDVGAFCQTANNLNDVNDAASSRTNLGIEAIATVPLGASKFAARDSNDAAPEAKDITDFALTLLDDATAAAMRSTLGISNTTITTVDDPSGTFPAGATLRAIPHPLNQVPKFVRVVGRCIEADVGYTVDEEVEAAAFKSAGSVPVWFYCDDMNVYVGSPTVTTVMSPGAAGTAVSITSNRWKYRIYCTA